MKVASAAVERTLRSPADAIRAFLIYGPDRGLVTERGGQLAKALGVDLNDPFASATLEDDALKTDPLRLDDELRAQSLMGGDRLVRIRMTSETAAGPVLEALAAIDAGGLDSPTRLIVLAGDLKKTSKLRKAFEASPAAAAIASYTDDARDLGRLVEQTFSEHGLSLAPDARARLLEHLEGDRALARAEMDKLMLYMSDASDSVVTRADVDAIASGAEPASISDFAEAAASGDAAGAERALTLALRAGGTAVGASRALLRVFMRLAAIKAHMAARTPLDRAITMTGPPLYGPRREALIGQANAWSQEMIETAIAQITDVERKLKSGANIDAALVSRLGLALASRARARDGRA